MQVCEEAVRLHAIHLWGAATGTKVASTRGGSCRHNRRLLPLLLLLQQLGFLILVQLPAGYEGRAISLPCHLACISWLQHTFV